MPSFAETESAVLIQCNSHPVLLAFFVSFRYVWLCDNANGTISSCIPSVCPLEYVVACGIARRVNNSQDDAVREFYPLFHNLVHQLFISAGCSLASAF